jgi:hypothetical protein
MIVEVRGQMADHDIALDTVYGLEYSGYTSVGPESLV